MHSNMQFDIVSANAQIFSGKIRMLTVTGSAGELGIHPGHTALLTSLKPGKISIMRDDGTAQGSEEIFYISGGILEVQPDKVSVLGDHAARGSDLDEAAAQAAKQHAEQQLADAKSGKHSSHAAKQLNEALAQLQIIKELRKKTRLR